MAWHCICWYERKKERIWSGLGFEEAQNYTFHARVGLLLFVFLLAERELIEEHGMDGWIALMNEMGERKGRGRIKHTFADVFPLFARSFARSVVCSVRNWINKKKDMKL
jgi:hypothetical protein